MSDDPVWENKLWNATLAADIEAGVIDDHYWPHLEQQLLVSGASKAYFTASDGTIEKTVGMWYQSVPKRRRQ
ncbi:MAG: Heme peroxidase, partial [Deltaproteobacteria bacterium]|nr:Heme peroxidase [Deltaproteobacteria bacterium]